MTKIDRWIEAFAQAAYARAGVDIEFLLKNSLGRVMHRDESFDDETFLLHYPQSKLDHIRDWLIAAVKNEERWLLRVNADGVPLKIAKFGTFQQIVDEADKATRKFITRGLGRNGGGEVDYEFSNGFTMVRLQSPEDLAAESAMMQHCVGQGGYDKAIALGESEIFSLRDSYGKSHATVEIFVNKATGGREVEQVKGKQNVVPRLDYFLLVLEWLDGQGAQFTSTDHPINFAVDRAGKLVDLTSLGDGAVFNGDIIVNIYDDGEAPFFQFPKNFTINGDFTMYGPDRLGPLCTTLLDDIGFHNISNIEGSLSLSRVHISLEVLPNAETNMFSECMITQLPEVISSYTVFSSSDFPDKFQKAVRFDGHVSIRSTNKPFNSPILGWMNFAGDLSLHHMQDMQIPDGISIGGSLDISQSTVDFMGSIETHADFRTNNVTIRVPPTSLVVKRDLRLHRTTLNAFPNDTFIGGAFHLSTINGGAKIPLNAYLGGDVHLDTVDLSSFGQRSEFNGNLHLRRTDITKLVDGTKVAGTMTVYRTPLKRLPKNLEICDDLVISHCNLARIPSCAKIGRDLILKHSYVMAVPKGFSIPGDLDITGHGAFVIPEDVTLGGTLKASRAELEKIGANFSAHSIDASDSALETLPRGLSLAGFLNVENTRIRKVPDDLHVGEDANFINTYIKHVPASASVDGTIHVDDYVVMEKIQDQENNSLVFPM